MLKIFKRYSVVSILIIFCYFSAFIALCNGLLSTVQASSLIQKENQYAYSNEVQATIRVAESITPDLLYQLMDNVDTCNVYIENMEIYFEEIDGVYRPEILLSQNEKLSLPISKNISNIPTGAIIAASSNVGEEKQLIIHGKCFSIYDKMNTDEFPFVTGLFVLNANDYFEAFPNALTDATELTLRIASNKNNAYFAYSQIQENMKKFFSEAKIYGSDVTSTESIFQSALSQENLISVGLFLFALINTIVISYYWVVVRRREISIRKAFGASNFTVIRLMTTELLKLIGFSALLATVVQSVIWMLQGNSIDVMDSIVIGVVLLISITIAVVVVMIAPVRCILQIRPSEGVKL